MSFIQVSHKVKSGWQCREQLLEWKPVFGPRFTPLPVLHHLWCPTEAPLLWASLLRRLHWPHRQPGLRGHRGSLRLPLSHVQVHPSTRWPAARPRRPQQPHLRPVLESAATGHQGGGMEGKLRMVDVANISVGHPNIYEANPTAV